MIVLSENQLARIKTISEQTYPEEACGLLVGRDLAEGVVVTRVVESPNVRKDRMRDRFEIDPQIRIAVERSLRDGPERLVGHFHSHPDHPARPSSTDLEMAFEPNLIWLIVAVAEGRAVDINAYRLDEVKGVFDPIEIREKTEPKP
jgi:proteasome lid subunit RPN8/RPN11